MPRYLLHHRHHADECGAVFASFKGNASPLRHLSALASCLSGDHSIWWTVESECGNDAIALLPRYVGVRTAAVQISDVTIP